MAEQLSHRFRCLFVHVPKTAGTSIETSPIFEDRRNATGQKVGGHTSALELRERFPEEFASYFRFGFVRNPWDRLVSAYHHFRRHDEMRERWLGSYAGFDDFCLGFLDHSRVEEIVLLRPQHRFLCDEDGELLVDFVGRFERLQRDFGIVAARIGYGGRLPRKRQAKGRHRHYSACYSSEARNRVADLYAEDIERFGYAFRVRRFHVSWRRHPLVDGGRRRLLRLRRSLRTAASSGGP